jgi:hypothetical protein
MRFRLLLGLLGLLSVVVWTGSAAGDPSAGPHICSSAGQALTGTYYGDLKVKGNAYVPAGASLEVIGDLTLAPGSCLDAFSTATVTLDADVIVRDGATLALGCTPQSIGPVPPCGTTTTHDTVYGSITAHNPLTMYLDGDTIRGDVISHGGGPGRTLSPYVNFPIKDNTILGDVVVTDWQGAWFGLLRNHINGSVKLANITGVAIGDDGTLDSTEVTDNSILGSLDCHGNFPPAQVGDSGGGPNSVFSWTTGECATMGSAVGAVPINGQPAPSAPVPSVTGPVDGTIPPAPLAGAGTTSVTPDVLSAFGYRQQELFFSGTASAYDFSGAPTADGQWSVTPVSGSAKPYTSKLEVFMPTNPHRFSGNVIVEWENVTAGWDYLPDMIIQHATAFSEGDAIVAVDAQFVGVENAILNDPSRYSSLSHPGDSYAWDIFSQAGMAVWDDYDQVLGGLQPRDLIADGESQSATYLSTYIDGFAKLFNVYDGYLVHSRGANIAPLQRAPGNSTVVSNNTTFASVSVPNGNVGLTNVSTPANAQSRTDLLAPVVYLQSQTDVFSPPYGLLGYGPATQPDSAGFRLWEVAGSAHSDICLADLCPSDAGAFSTDQGRFDDLLDPTKTFSVFPPCGSPINAGEEGYVQDALLVQLINWVLTGGVDGGTPVASPPLFQGQTPGEASAGSPQLDSFGNILGGVRNPAVDVPLAQLTGMPNTPGLCSLLGTTVPFDSATIHALYPDHGTFVSKWTQDVASLKHDGYLTKDDAADLVHAAAISSVP